MISRGDGGTPRQERKRKSGGRKKQGGGVSAGRKKPVHGDLARVDPALLKGLKQWSAKKTFVHQFRVAATAAPVTPPRQAVFTSVRKRVMPLPGLAAVKHAQAMRRDRAAALDENLRRQKHGRAVRSSGPSSMGELYAYYKRNGMLEVFFSMFP
jgi:hypothetical protein